MLKLYHDKRRQTSIYESMLPQELFQLNEELSKVDRLLDDEAFMEPFTKRFRTRTGRATVPVEVYIRLMYLKHRYELGYETLVKEVADSIKWRTFCRLQLDDPVPDSTTLIKSTKRYGEDTIKELNELLVRKAKEKKIIRGRKLRVDSTVVEADIHYPTDSSILADGIRVITRTVKKLKETGSKEAQGFVDHTRKVKKRLYKLAQILKSNRKKGEPKKEQIQKITAEIKVVAEEVVSSAEDVRSKLGSHPVAEKLDQQTGLLKKIIDQTEKVLAGQRHIPRRIVSFFDPEAHPIKKGKMSKPVEFGRKLNVAVTEEQVVTDYNLQNGNPPDSDLLIPAVEAHTRLVGKPRAVTADVIYGTAENRRKLTEMGISRIGIRARGRKSAERKEFEKQWWFKLLQRFRAGVESVISLLKRKYGITRSRYKGTAGNNQWVGLSIMAYNLRRMAQLC